MSPRPLAALFLAASLSHPASAADLAILNGEKLGYGDFTAGKCSLSLKGPISDGDAGRLELLLEDEALVRFVPARLDFGISAEAQVLCLDSIGGDSGAALQLADVIAGRGLVTMVADGMSCVGPCAVAFMAGSVLSSNSDGGARMPMRFLHVGGQLGFHAPQPDRMDAGSALDYVAQFTATFQGIDSFTPTARFHPGLFAEMLARRDAQSALMITTTGEAGLYDISLAGVPPVETDEAGWMRACNNLSLQAQGGQSRSEPDLSSWAWSVNLPVEGYMPNARLPPSDSYMDTDPEHPGADFHREVLSRHHQCLIYANADASPAFSAWFERVAEDAFPRLRLFDLWQTLPHYTPLAALRGMEKVEPADFRTLYALPPVIGAHPDFPPISSLSPGHSLMLRDPGEGRYKFAIWFGDEGTGRRYLEGEAPEELRYRSNEDGICITEADAAEACGKLVTGEDGLTTLTLGDRVFEVIYLRPGDTGPLPQL